MNSILDMLMIIPAIIIGISFHEYAHAMAAIALGDNTPKAQGRDTLNPIAHIDPIGFICLLIAHFGWGRPVQIDVRNFKKPLRDQMLVALAGPVMNLVISFVSLIIYNIVLNLNLLNGLNETVALMIDAVLTYMVIINVSLFIFNLLPLPHFDGTKVLMYFLPTKGQIVLLKLERYSFIVFLLIILTDIPELIVTPILFGILNGMQWLINLVIGLF